MSHAFHQLMLPECQRLVWSALTPTAQFPGRYTQSQLKSWDLLKSLSGPHLGARSLFQTNASLPDGLMDEMKLREVKERQEGS